VDTLLADSDEPGALRLWGVRLGVGAGLVLLIAGIAWLAHAMISTNSGPARQVARIAILPDSPPPPPPPKEEKKPEPKEEKTVQVEQPKPQEAPAPQPEQLKMDGPTGVGPSAFAAGEIRNEYKGGDVGTSIGGDNRGQFNAFAAQLAQQVREALSRRKLDVKSLRIFVWLDPGGSILRHEVAGVVMTPDLAREIDAAFAELDRTRDAPPSNMPMPVGLQVSLR